MARASNDAATGCSIEEVEEDKIDEKKEHQDRMCVHLSPHRSVAGETLINGRATDLY